MSFWKHNKRGEDAPDINSRFETGYPFFVPKKEFAPESRYSHSPLENDYYLIAELVYKDNLLNLQYRYNDKCYQMNYSKHGDMTAYVSTSDPGVVSNWFNLISNMLQKEMGLHE